MQSYTPVVPEKRAPTARQQMMAVVPLMMLGLLAATCLLASAEWKSGGDTTSLLGAGEETAAAHVCLAVSLPPSIHPFLSSSVCG